MHLYIAALFTNNYRKTQNRYEKLTEGEKQIFDNTPNILESYHYIKGQRFVDVIRDQGAKVFLDSGAFSAWNIGTSVDIDAYCDYVIKNRDIFRVECGEVMASVLDGIGDPLKTYQNQIYMESKGAKPLPCFHYGEDPQYLDYYLANYNYITIGGLVGKSKPDQEKWLDRIWNNHILNGAGRAKVAVHGFGMTAESLMKRYDWFSCDSSSWIQNASFGGIFTTEWGPISVSSDSPSIHENGRHLTTLREVEQENVKAMLARKGFNLERLSTVYESRASYNCGAYQDLNLIVNNYIKNNNYQFNCGKVQELF